MSGNEETGPVNETPGFIKDIFDTVVVFLQSYGWFVVLGLAVAFYFKGYIEQAFRRWRSNSHQPTDYHRYDSDAVLSRQQAMDEARRRMQEQYDAQAARHEEEMKKKQEEKRKQKLEDWDRHLEGKGYRSKYRPPEENSSDSASSTSRSAKKKPVYRPSDYNPLTGSGSSSNYRPERRSGSMGGGG